MLEALRPWRLMGQAELDPNRAVDEPRLPCGSIVDPKIEMEADREAEEFAAENKWYVYSWPAVACLPDMAIAAVASIGMQVVETILVVALAEELAQVGCIIVIMVAALVTVAVDVRCVSRTAISFVQEVQRFAVPLPLPEALKHNFCLYLCWGLANTVLHMWWLGSFTLATLVAIKNRHISHEVVVWLLINFRYVWGFLVFWTVKERPNGVVKSSAYRPPGEAKLSYQNVLGQEMGKTEFLHGLAATLGMHTMMLQITPYRRTRVTHNMEVVETAVADGNQVKAREEWGYCLGDFRRLINHLDMQFVVTHIPKACTVLYQCFRLALSLAKEAALPHRAEVLSILCAFASFAPVLITIAQVELLYCTLVPLCERKDFKGPDGGHERRGYTDKQEKDMRPPIRLFRVAYAVACLFHLLAGAQIVMLLLGRRDLLPGAALFVSTD